MTDAKYIGMDVHTATISAAVRDSSGNLVMEATLETKAETILEFVQSHGPRVPDRTMVAKFDRRSALLVSEQTASLRTGNENRW